jgi:hypothetical protein
MEGMRLWKDEWFDNFRILMDHAQQELLEKESNVTVENMVDLSHQWK